MPEYYEIKIKGHLDGRWSSWFSGLHLEYLADDVTLISGILPDQGALHGLLERVRDLNLTLLSVICGGGPVGSPPHEQADGSEDLADPGPVA